MILASDLKSPEEDERLKRYPPPWGPPPIRPRPRLGPAKAASSGGPVAAEAMPANDDDTASSAVTLFPRSAQPSRASETADPRVDAATGAEREGEQQAGEERGAEAEAIDWASIRAAFETSSVSGYHLSVSRNVSYVALLRRAHAEGWKRRRRDPGAQVRQEHEEGAAGEASGYAWEEENEGKEAADDETEEALDRFSVEESHKKVLALQGRLIRRLMLRLEAFLDGKLERRFILGRNESPSLVILRLGRTLERNIKMERIVHRLDQDPQSAEPDPPMLREAIAIMTPEEMDVFAAVARRLEESWRAKQAHNSTVDAGGTGAQDSSQKATAA